MIDIFQNPSSLEPQTTPALPGSQAFVAPSPVFPAGGAASGPNPPFSSGGFTPVAGQMTLTDDAEWTAQTGVPATIFWPPYNSLSTVIAPAFNPDGIASLTVPVPNVVSNFLPPHPGNWPGYVAPEDGVYFVNAQVQLTSSLESPVIDNPSIVIVAWKPDGSALTQRIDENWQGVLGNDGVTNVAYTLSACGLMSLSAGDLLFNFIDTRNNSGGANYAVAGFSFFGCHRVR